MAFLRIVEGAQRGQLLILRPPGPCVIGRARRCAFQILDRRVSRRHLSIAFRNEGYVLTDLESSGGTFVGGTREQRVLLRDGDDVRIGSSVLRFELEPRAGLIERDLGGYHVVERVGSGGMGTVYRARQRSLDRVVALKVLGPKLSGDDEFRTLFIQEARAAAELSHPRIVRVYDVNLFDGVLFYAMEYAAKGSVEDLIRQQVRLEVSQALQLTHQAIQGLEYAERVGIVHRDIKPANLMLAEDGGLKIGDLGVAVRLRGHADSSPREGGVSEGLSGSPPYMAPEQVLGRTVDHRSDLYSLGASLYEMVTGCVPYRGDTVKDVLLAHIKEAPPDARGQRADLPEGVAELIKRLMAKSPENRPASASEARSDLERLTQSTPAEIRPRRRPARRIPSAVFYAMAFVLATIAGFLVAHGLL